MVFLLTNLKLNNFRGLESMAAKQRRRWKVTHYFTIKRPRETPGMAWVFWNLEAHLQWHSGYNNVTPNCFWIVLRMERRASIQSLCSLFSVRPPHILPSKQSQDVFAYVKEELIVTRQTETTYAKVMETVKYSVFYHYQRQSDLFERLAVQANIDLPLLLF